MKNILILASTASILFSSDIHSRQFYCHNNSKSIESSKTSEWILTSVPDKSMNFIIRSLGSGRDNSRGMVLFSGNGRPLVDCEMWNPSKQFALCTKNAEGVSFLLYPSKESRQLEFILQLNNKSYDNFDFLRNRTSNSLVVKGECIAD